MLGRGAVTRPDLIARVDNPHSADSDATVNTALSWQDLLPHQINFLEGKAKNDIVLVGRYKQWLALLTKGYVEAQVLWNDIKREKNKAAIITALQISAQA